MNSVGGSQGGREWKNRGHSSAPTVDIHFYDIATSGSGGLVKRDQRCLIDTSMKRQWLAAEIQVFISVARLYRHRHYI